MNRRQLTLGLAAGAAMSGAFSPAFAQPGPKTRSASGYRPSGFTPFEKKLLDRISLADGKVREAETAGPADKNARGLALDGGKAAILNFAVQERKYGISLDGTEDVLVKNFSFSKRRSQDIFGSGLILGQKVPTKAETWVSNAWIDLKGAGPVEDYKKANNEAITIEKGNKRLNIREAVLLGGEESGLDNKCDVQMDAAFVASGHRPVRTWSSGSLVLANSIVLALPGHGGFWFGGGKETAKLDYFNCRFGKKGDKADALSDTIPEWMITIEDGVQARISKLAKDPFDRSAASFWVGADTPVPAGYLAGR